MVGKGISVIVLIGVVFSATLSQGADVPANPLEKPGWTLDFHDEFDGPTLNTNVWLPYYLPHHYAANACFGQSRDLRLHARLGDGAHVVALDQDEQQHRGNRNQQRAGHHFAVTVHVSPL